MRISVLIPAYNCEAYLVDAINSVLGQSYPVHEIFVVDDGSTDGTGEVVRRLQRNGAKIEYIRTENRGVAAARNTGLDRISGDAVALLDADDAWYPRKLELQVRALEAHPDVQAICTDFSLVDQEGEVILERHVRTKYRVFDAYSLDWPDMFPSRDVFDDRGTRIDLFYGDAFRALLLGNFVNTSSMLLRLEAVKATGRFTVGRRTQTDYEFWLKLAMRCPIAYLDVPLLLFRRRPNQLTSDDQAVRVAQDVADVVAEVADAARDRVGDRIMNQRVAERFRLLAIALLLNRQPLAARRAIARARTYAGVDPSIALLYLWSWMPAGVGAGLRNAYARIRALKGTRQTASGRETPKG
jgi:glycosyltransferase involved in cell wall biosynthesis